MLLIEDKIIGAINRYLLDWFANRSNKSKYVRWKLYNCMYKKEVTQNILYLGQCYEIGNIVSYKAQL